MRVINIVEFESYLKGVLPREVYPSWPAEALKAAEVRIELAFEKFENAVKLGSEEVSVLSEELERLIKARNNECKLYK